MTESKIRQLERTLRHFNLDITPETYRRVAEFLDSMSIQKENLDSIISAIFVEEGYEGMVIEKDIPLCSFCEHHILPWFGLSHIAYIAHGKVLGLSKFTRIVNYFSTGLTLQERVTKQIADFFENYLSKDTMVMVEAIHSCMIARGVRNPFTTSISIEARGLFREMTGPRLEFFSALNSSHYHNK